MLTKLCINTLIHNVRTGYMLLKLVAKLDTKVVYIPKSTVSKTNFL